MDQDVKLTVMEEEIARLAATTNQNTDSSQPTAQVWYGPNFVLGPKKEDVPLTAHHS